MEDKPVSIEALVGATAEGVFFRITYYAVDGEYHYLAYFDGNDSKVLTAWPDGTLYYADVDAIWMQMGEQPSIMSKGCRLEDL